MFVHNMTDSQMTGSMAAIELTEEESTGCKTVNSFVVASSIIPKKEHVKSIETHLISFTNWLCLLKSADNALFKKAEDAFGITLDHLRSPDTKIFPSLNQRVDELVKKERDEIGQLRVPGASKNATF